MHTMLPVSRIKCISKLVRICSICKGSHEHTHEGKYLSTILNSYLLRHFHQGQYDPNSSQAVIKKQILFSKRNFPLSTSSSKVVQLASDGSAVGFVRGFRSRPRHVAPEENAGEAVEAGGSVIISNDLTPDKETESELINYYEQKGKHSSASVREKGLLDKNLIARESVDELTLPELSRMSFSLVPYVKRSATLQKLVMLGVDLDKVQKIRDVPELLIKSDFNKDILPLFRFLSRLKVPVAAMGSIFTKNPLMFKESVESLELRVGYLIHKKFTLKDVSSMAIRDSVFLLMDHHKLDEKLGFLQTTFQLTGKEVRQVALTYPKILPWRKELIADVRFHIKEFIGFNDSELKQIILKDPSLYMISKLSMVKRFEYLHHTMLISHEQILHWPSILASRLFIIKNRHLFLVSLARAQYDPCLENYVSLRALASGTDEEFCKNVAKSDVQKFYDFCKTL